MPGSAVAHQASGEATDLGLTSMRVLRLNINVRDADRGGLLCWAWHRGGRRQFDIRDAALERDIDVEDDYSCRRVTDLSNKRLRLINFGCRRDNLVPS